MESLARDTVRRAQQALEPVDFDDGGFNDEIVARVASHFGDIATAAEKLRVPPHAVERTLARYTAQMKQRTAN